MNSRLLPRNCPIAAAVAISALCLFPGCIAGDQDLSTTEDPLNVVPGYTGYAVVRDWNGDSFPDLEAINLAGSTFAVRLNKGDGTFHNVVRYSVDPQPTFIATSDMNHDGALDVNVISATLSTFSTFFGEATGHSSRRRATPSPPPCTASSPSPRSGWSPRTSITTDMRMS